MATTAVSLAAVEVITALQ
jgi:hypothetical protein